MPKVVDPKRDAEETRDAFVIVLGMSFFPLIFAFVGLMLIHFNIIRVEEYNAEAATVKGLGRGLFVVTWFGVAGLCIPVMYALHVLNRNMRRKRKERESQSLQNENPSP